MRARHLLGLLFFISALSLPGCERTCLVDRGGCDSRESLDLEACVETDIISVEDILSDPATYAGPVAVRGHIRAEGDICTELGCSDLNACCNSCGSVLLLTDGADGDLQIVSSPDAPINVGCVGDESLICCSVPTDGRELVITGSLMVDGDYIYLSAHDACTPR